MVKKAIIEIILEGKAGVATFREASITDIGQVAEIFGAVKEFIEENQPAAIIFDFDGVGFFSSPVLGMLLEVRAEMERQQGKVMICGINPQLYRVFKITSLDKIFTFYADRASAVKTANMN
jgi:anti-sigma B factor antagonist